MWRGKINALIQKFKLDHIKEILKYERRREQTRDKKENRLQEKEEGEKCIECERQICVNTLKHGRKRSTSEKYKKGKCDSIKQ